MALEFRCADVGADTCKAIFIAESWPELMQLVSNHLIEVHRVSTPTQTLMQFIAIKVTNGQESVPKRR